MPPNLPSDEFLVVDKRRSTYLDSVILWKGWSYYAPFYGWFERKDFEVYQRPSLVYVYWWICQWKRQILWHNDTSLEIFENRRIKTCPKENCRYPVDKKIRVTDPPINGLSLIILNRKRNGDRSDERFFFMFLSLCHSMAKCGFARRNLWLRCSEFPNPDLINHSRDHMSLLEIW